MKESLSQNPVWWLWLPERNRIDEEIYQYVDSSWFFVPKTIIFIRHINAKGQEISGYVDYAHRLKNEDFVPYFSGKKKLLPRVGDLR